MLSVEKLAEKIVQVLDHRDAYIRPREDIVARFSTERTVDAYEALFESMLEEMGSDA